MHYYHAQEANSTSPIVFKGGIEEYINEIAPPSDPGYATVLKSFYALQAASLAHQLYRTLPGGTLDALLLELLQIKSSILRVGYGYPSPTIEVN